MDRRPFIVVGAAVGLLASAVAVRRLLADPSIRKRIGLGTGAASDNVDRDSEDSFPASDPPSFTATTAGVGI